MGTDIGIGFVQQKDAEREEAMLLQVKEIKKHYHQFDLNCSMDVQEGSIVGLIGKNGAGKSTTFKAILNLLTPDAGSIRIFGKDSREMTNQERQWIGTVLSDCTFPDVMTVQEIGTVLESLYTEFQKADFFQKCEQFHIPLKQKLKEFSSGMRARLKLLIALHHNAKLLILDEPTAGMDVVAREEMLDLLREYMVVDGRSILISSHISSDLEKLCDEIYMIDAGNIILHEETDRILDCYGILKVEEAQYRQLDKRYLIRMQKESYGFCCLTNQKQFYMENYPDVIIEKGNIDEVINMMVKGERI